MKFLYFLIALIYSIELFAIVPKELSCSQKGTDIIFVNGVSWAKEVAAGILVDDIIPKLSTNHLDSKSVVSYKHSYNTSNGFLRDLLESAAQKISTTYGLDFNLAFVAAYFITYRQVVVVDFLSNIYNQLSNNKNLKFTDILNLISISFSVDTLSEMYSKALSQNQFDMNSLKKDLSESLISGRKVIFISESQGNLFLNQMVQDYQNGELLIYNGISSSLDKYKKVISQVQVATLQGQHFQKTLCLSMTKILLI